MDNLRDFASEALLAVASSRILVVLGEDFFELVRHDEGEVLEVFFESIVGLIEPELVEIEDRGLFGVEPDGIAFGFAEFATGDLVDDERTRVAVGRGILEALDEVDTRGAVAKLVSTAELEVNVVGAEEMKEIVALDESVAKFGIRDTRATFADAFLDELAVEELSHAKGFTDFAEEGKKFDIFEPIIIIDKLSAFGRMSDLDDLLGEGGLVVLDFVETLEVAFGGILRVANLAGGAADEVVRSIAVANKACAHHEGGEVADMK